MTGIGQSLEMVIFNVIDQMIFSSQTLLTLVALVEISIQGIKDNRDHVVYGLPVLRAWNQQL